MATKTCRNGHKYKGNTCPHCPNPNPDERRKPKVFGTTIQETIDALKPARLSKQTDKTVKQNRKIILFRLMISVAILVIAGVFFTTEEKGTATGLIGTVIGYWLK
jgi:hypothetical protein